MDVNITDLPIELLMTICFQLPSVSDLLFFEAVCRNFKSAVQQEEVWKKRIREDYPLLSYVSDKSPVFRRRGFRQLYRALQNPQVFVWGSKEDGRLGIPDGTLRSYGGFYGELNYPFWLKSMSEKGVSMIVCGGYMMIALTHKNEVYFWGSFNAETAMYPQAEIHETPLLLEIFPENSHIQHITAGRSHALALTKDGKAYHFDNAEDKASLVTFEGVQQTIAQIACGFNSSTCLTQDQKLYYWKYEPGVKVEQYTSLVTPTLKEEEKLTKIAGGEHFVLAATSLGRVFRWEMSLPQVESTEVSTPSEVLNLTLGGELFGEVMSEAGNLVVGHIVAQFRNFGLFDDKGRLWMGRCNPGNQRETCVWSLNEPQDFVDDGNPILCSFGDWHTGVVLDNGRLYTWGEHGLGHGSPDRGSLSEPRRVSYFKDNYFVFYASCSGWHTAALAVDLSIPPASEPPEYPEPPIETGRFRPTRYTSTYFGE